MQQRRVDNNTILVVEDEVHLRRGRQVGQWHGGGPLELNDSRPNRARELAG